MIVKDVYQSGINILIDGFKALQEESGPDDMMNYGSKSNTMFDHCQITFLVSDIRGVEIITLKSLANKVRILSVSPFTSPKKLRPTIFSNEYPAVNTTPEYQEFTNVTSQVVQKTISLISSLPDEIKSHPAIYKYNFAGSVAFDALVSFSGANITQLIGVFPGQGLRGKNGEWTNPNDQYFINKAIASFKKIYYDALEGIFGTVDMQTDAALEKMYFSKLHERDMSTLDLESGVVPNILFAQVIYPTGSMDLLSADRPRTTAQLHQYRQSIVNKMDYADNIVGRKANNSGFGVKSKFIEENATYIVYVKCSIQTLLMLEAYTDFVSYYSDMKNVLGREDYHTNVITETSDGVKIDGDMVYKTEDAASASIIASNNSVFAANLISDIEKEKRVVLEILRKYQRERDFYEENRYKNTKLRPPKSMIQRKEYYNMVPLYAQTCCVLKYSSKELEKINIDELPVNGEFKGIIMKMRGFITTAKSYFAAFDR